MYEYANLYNIHVFYFLYFYSIKECKIFINNKNNGKCKDAFTTYSWPNTIIWIKAKQPIYHPSDEKYKVPSS